MPECTRARAFWLGVKDGWANPVDLGFGLTWEDDGDLSDAYDRGANIGQWLGRLWA